MLYENHGGEFLFTAVTFGLCIWRAVEDAPFLLRGCIDGDSDEMASLFVGRVVLGFCDGLANRRPILVWFCGAGSL